MSEYLKAYVRNLAGYIESHLIPFLVEIHAGQIRERLQVVNGLMGLLKRITQLAFKTKDEQLILFIRKRIFTEIFVE